MPVAIYYCKWMVLLRDLNTRFPCQKMSETCSVCTTVLFARVAVYIWEGGGWESMTGKWSPNCAYYIPRLKKGIRLLHGPHKVTWPSFIYAGGFLYIVKCPINKLKVLYPAMIGLKKSFWMIYSKIPLRFWRTLPSNCCTYICSKLMYVHLY